ncbi:MAG: hypothetical protein HY290_20120 [Planctomycetia bacterium]|nr:hypothetical protein [Planctomycetia bacterium]
MSALVFAQETGRGRRGATGDARRGTSSLIPFLSRLESWSAQALAGIAKVRDELALTAEQKQKLDDLQTSTSDRQRELYAEYQRRAAEMNQQVDADVRKLLDEKQNARLSQLQWQRRGVAALALPEVAEKLGLSAEQRENLATLARQESSRGSFSPGFGDRIDGTARGGFNAPGTPGAFDFGTASARAREAREKLAAEMIAVLTPEQKTKWDELLGAKFEFPAAGGFGGSGAADFQILARARNFELGQLRGSARGRATAIQRLGPTGPFRYQSIVDELSLSEDQKAQILAIGKEDAEAIGQIGASAGAEVTAKIEQISKTTQEKLDKVLNEEQRNKLKALLNPQTP